MGEKIEYTDVIWKGTFQEILVDGIPLDIYIEDKIKNMSDFIKNVEV